MDEDCETDLIARIKNILLTVGGLLFYIFLAVGGVVLLLLFFKGTPWIAENIYPFVNAISGIALIIAVPLSLILSIFKRTRGIGGAGLFISSYAVGINLWVWSLMVAYSLAGVVWLVVGVLAGGVGVVPIAIIASLLKTQWRVAVQILILVVVVFALRGFGAYLAGKASQEEIDDAQEEI